MAHVGAIKAIEDVGLKPEVISGTSAGAIAAVLYADGYAPEEIVSFFVGKQLKEFAQIHLPTVSLFELTGFRNFLKKHLRSQTFEELNIPVRIVATNFDKGKTQVFSKGPIIKPLCASCCIPIVFAPVEIDGSYYVDGGIFKNFPVSIIREESEKVIGINVSPMAARKYNQTILSIAERSYHFMSRTNTFEDRELCDVLIEIEDLLNYKTFDLKNANNIFKIGYEHGTKALNENKQQISNLPGINSPVRE